MGHTILQAGSSPFHPREGVEADPLVELEHAWARSDALFAFLGPERLAARPIGLRHPCLFYLGHLPAFAWNQVGRGVLERPPVHPTFGRLFERGIDPKDQAEAEASAIEGWPEVAEVVAYREAVRERCRRQYCDPASRRSREPRTLTQMAQKRTSPR